MVREHPSEHPLIGSAPNGLEAQNNAHAHTHTYAIVHTHTRTHTKRVRRRASQQEERKDQELRPAGIYVIQSPSSCEVGTLCARTTQQREGC